MLDAEMTTFLEGGSALIVGTVDPDGVPHACRAWALDVVAAEPGRLRLLLDAHDLRARENLAAGAQVAVTAADVLTLRSVQLKGTSLGEEPMPDNVDERVARYTGSFYDDIETTDGTPRRVLERLTPGAVVAVGLTVGELYDQTPGPSAGQRVGDER
ncbi:MAG: pyridoxamine 5'-phosphate oxidase family protein [Acidimicrobiales bacterium]